MMDFETSSSTTPERGPLGEGDPLRVVRLVTRVIVARRWGPVKEQSPFWQGISLQECFRSTDSLVDRLIL